MPPLPSDPIRTTIGEATPTMRQAISAVLAILAASLAYAALAQTPPPLIQYLEAEARRERTKSNIERLEALQSTPSVRSLRIAHADAAPALLARALSLALPDSGVVLRFEHIEVEVLDSGNYAINAESRAQSSLALIVSGDSVMGIVRHQGALYELQALEGALTAVYRVDPRAVHEAPAQRDDFIVAPQERAIDGSRVPPRAGPRDRRDEIDVLVVYTEGAKRDAGDIDAAIDLLVSETNRFYTNSAITTRLRLAHAYQTPTRDIVSEGPMPDDWTELQRLLDAEDGYHDEAHERRERYRADIVILLHGNESWCGGGRAYLVDPYRGSGEYAYGVIGLGSKGCLTFAAFTFAHEVGHNQGAKHNPEALYEGRTSEHFPYAHGYCNAETDWRTVMAYNTDGLCRDRIPHLSNPDVLYDGVPTGEPIHRNVARHINEVAEAVANFRTRAQGPPHHVHRLPFVLAHRTSGMHSFVRVHNRSEHAGKVTIRTTDDTGETFGPVTLSVAARRTAGFNSRDLEEGNATRRLPLGVGDGTGHWRLELETALDIEARAYVRSTQGSLASMNQVAPEERSRVFRYHVAFFNPASNTSMVSWLRIANPHPTRSQVHIEAWDASGRSAEAPIKLTLAPYAAAMLSAQQLEAGDDDAFEGRLGDGKGKWEFIVSSETPRALQIMSLIRSRDGHLTNVSR